MAKHRYAVLGATGHTGRVVVEGLLECGHEVRAVCRERVKLDPLVKLGARLYPVEIEHHVPALVEAFEGVDAVYAMIPPNFGVDDYLKFEDHVGENIVAAIQRTGVRWVVNLSALGADLRSGTGPIQGLHRQEKRLDKISGLHVMHLRPAFFLEELLHWIPDLRKKDRIGCLFQKDLSLELVATRDVGRKAVERLDRLDFHGSGFLEICGPRAYRMDEVAEVLGRAVGIPALAYQQIDEELEEKALLARGFTRYGATLWIELEHAINEGRVKARDLPFRGEVDLETWVADTFVPAFRAKVG